MAIQILAALTSARVVAVDGVPQKLELAREAGASEAIMAGGDAAAQIRELTRGQGAELVLDLVGAGSTLALAAVAVCKLGHLTLVGLAGGSIPFNFFAVPYECSIATTYWGQRSRVDGGGLPCGGGADQVPHRDLPSRTRYLGLRSHAGRALDWPGSDRACHESSLRRAQRPLLVGTFTTWGSWMGIASWA